MSLARPKKTPVYSDLAMQHYQRPQNVGTLDEDDPNVGSGIVGSPACGDVMKLQIKVDKEGKIVDAKFKTFGCGAAVSSSSLATTLIKGKMLDDAVKLKNSDISGKLGLPPVKLHCSVLAEEALKQAIDDYREKQSKLPEGERGKAA